MRDFFLDILPSEQRRCRYCRGCIFFAQCDHFGSCDYFMRTGKRRPSKPGLPDCPVREYPENYKQPKGHADFCARVDAEIKAAEEAERAMLRRAERLAKRDQELTDDELEQFDADNPGAERKKGRPLSWDAKYGFKLFMEGYYFYEIADVLGVKRNSVVQYATLHDWRDKYPKGQPRQRHDIAAAIEEYQQFKTQKAVKGKDKKHD